MQGQLQVSVLADTVTVGRIGRPMIEWTPLRLAAFRFQIDSKVKRNLNADDDTTRDRSRGTHLRIHVFIYAVDNHYLAERDDVSHPIEMTTMITNRIHGSRLLLFDTLALKVQ